LQCTAIGVCNGFGMLIHWSRCWLPHPHTFSTVHLVGPSIEHIQQKQLRNSGSLLGFTALGDSAQNVETCGKLWIRGYNGSMQRDTPFGLKKYSI
jgi:hypothetical protein